MSARVHPHINLKAPGQTLSAWGLFIILSSETDRIQVAKKSIWIIMKKFNSIQFNSILDILDRHANEKPNDLAFAALKNSTTPSATLSYSQLRHSVATIAAHLQTLAGRGERVILLYAQPFDFLVAFLGCLYAGLIAVPTPLPNTFTAKRVLARMQGIFQDARPALVLTTFDELEGLKSAYHDVTHGNPVTWVATDQIPVPDVVGEPVEVTENSLAYLQYTSGSTSTPKGVMITHGNIVHQSDYMKRVWTKDGTASGVACWMPYYHDFGLFTGTFFPLYMGIPSYLMSPVTFIRRPELWLESISHYRLSHTAAPVFAFDLCTRKLTPDQRAKLDLSCLHVASLGAEPIHRGIVEEFIRVFQPHGFKPDAMIPAYGLAEATLVVTATPLSGGPAITSFNKSELARRRVAPANGSEATWVVSSGRQLADVPVEIVNENTLQRCGPDEIGEIWVGGDSIADGYWEKDQESEKTFRAHLADAKEGPFLRTGDLGFFHNGMIYIAGRIKDIMIFQGQNFYPQDIEWTVQESHPSLQKGGGAAFSVEVDEREQLVVSQELGVAVTDKAEFEKIASTIRRAIAAEHALITYAVVFLRKGTIPKTSSGKIQHHAARNDFLNGKTESVVYISYTSALQSEETTPRTELEAALAAIFEEVLKVSPIGIDDIFFERGGDSLSFLILSDLVEERLGLTIPLDKPMENLSVRLLARVLSGGEEQKEEISRWGGLLPLSAFKTALQHVAVRALKFLPYETVDGFARWLGRQPWAQTVFFRQDLVRFQKIRSATGKPLPDQNSKSEWTYSNLFYHWRIAALNNKREFARRVRVTGLEYLENARKTSRGLIFLSSNVGLKHLAFILLTEMNVDDVMQVGGGMRTLGIVGLSQFRSQFLLAINEELIKSNSHLSFQLAKGKHILEQGGVLIIAGDGQRGHQKKEIPFLNRRRPFGTGFAELAITTDALVVPVLTSLRENGTADIIFHPPLIVPEGSREEQVRSLVEQYARLLEEYWRTDLPNVRWKQMKQYLSLPPIE